METYDFVIIGGGLVGSAIGYGLARAGHQVAVLDEGDVAHRASRGNFGLVWVQSKGLDMPCYSDWTQSSSKLWLDLAPELFELTGIDVQHQRPGGVQICHTEEELRQRRATLNRLRDQTQGRFHFEMLDHKALTELIPAIGKGIAGASWCEMDGHANPLNLLRALQAGIQLSGGAYRPEMRVRSIAKDGTGHRIEAKSGVVKAARVVLAAGLANRTLASQVGLDAPLTPNRGQVLITERVAPLLNLPTPFVRQTGDGTLQLGDSHEDVGMNDGTLTDVLAEIARRALRDFPVLENVRIVRGWGCLRIMTPDGCPIYQQSPSYPGVFLVCCHSGVTLAAAHAKRLAPWIAGAALPDEITPLTAERFHVSTPISA